MGLFEIICMAAVVFLFLLVMDHGKFTLKSLATRWLLSRKKATKVLPFESSPGFALKKPADTL